MHSLMSFLNLYIDIIAALMSLCISYCIFLFKIFYSAVVNRMPFLTRNFEEKKLRLLLNVYGLLILWLFIKSATVKKYMQNNWYMNIK